MRNARVANQALSLSLATESTARNTYICRACLSQTTSPSSQFQQIRYASSEPFYKRIQNSIFGTKGSKAAEQARETARQKQLDELKSSTPEEKKQRKKVELHNGQVFEVAEVVDPQTHADYVVSRDWKGMERVGGENWVRERADGGEKYVGFSPREIVKLDGEEWEAVSHCVAAEVLCLRKAGRDVLEVCNARVVSSSSGDGEKRAAAAAMEEVVVSDKTGALVLKVKAEQEKAILQSISQTSSSEERTPEALEQELQQALASGGGRLFMGMKLDDARVKFAILKRTTQLTGKRIPDILLSNASTLDHLHRALSHQATPKKLHETPQLQMLAATAPNIQVHEKRRTHVHKDREIGRWKLIEEEMSLRGMPTRGGGIVKERMEV